MGTDWRDTQIRYLVHFDDSRAGMRHRDEPRAVGDELRDDGDGNCVERIEPLPNTATASNQLLPRISLVAMSRAL